MNTNYTIKNFRVFDENGANVDLKPLTILTGCNSSGKSSIVKSVMLLNSFLGQVKNAVEKGEPIELYKYKLDFTTYPNNLLGRFDRVVNNGSNSGIVTFEYSVYSRILSANLDVRMEFEADEHDELNNAYLKSYSILRDGTVIFSCVKGENAVFNLNLIKDEFYSFVEAEYIAHNYCGLLGAYELVGNISKEEYESQTKHMIDYLRSINSSRRSDIFQYVRTANVRNSLAIENKYNPALLEWSKENASFFNIPVIDWLNTLSKDELAERVSAILGEMSNGETMATKKVIEDLVASGFSSFGEYFKSKENEFLNNAIQVTPNNSKTPFIPTVSNMEIRQDYILVGPFSFDAIPIDLEDPILSEEEKKTQKHKDIEAWENRPVSFSMIYETVMYWNSKFCKEESSFYTYHESEADPFGTYTHPTYQLLCAYGCRIINEALLPDWAGNMSYVSSSRVDVNRLYSLDGKDDFTQLLKNYFEKRRLFIEQQKEGYINAPTYEPNSFFNKWVKAFGIGDSVSFHIDEEGLGVQIRLHKTPGDKGRLLADEGYGITQLISILLQIETAILSAQGEKVNKFYGLESLDRYKTNEFHYEINTIAIEEPEIHLHPRMQSLLADMFVEAYKNYNIHFIVETHSEYLIRKLQVLVANNHGEQFLSNQEVSLLYIYNKEETELQNEPQVKHIGICKDGYLNDSFGSGFFDEANSLSRQLM